MIWSPNYATGFKRYQDQQQSIFSFSKKSIVGTSCVTDSSLLDLRLKTMIYVAFQQEDHVSYDLSQKSLASQQII